MNRLKSIRATWSILVAALPCSAAEVPGNHDNPNKDFGREFSYWLVGETTFGRMSGAQAGDLDPGGHALVIKTGGGKSGAPI